jgi:ribonucleoside-diphosphate reductase alpha chain
MTAAVPEQAKKEYVHIQRLFVPIGTDPFEMLEWKRVDAVITNPKGEEKFRQDNIEVPAWWSETQWNIVAEKYFRVVNGVKEYSARQMFHRVAHWLAYNGVKQGIFLGDAFLLRDEPPTLDNLGYESIDAKAFYDELVYMGLNGMHAFNSPVWFNVGVKQDPQCSACFIQSAGDRMTDIMDLAKREVMLFKGGSGTGSNLSPLRSSYETLSTGGLSSGPVSFMEGFDAFAGVTKSGGSTRRAAKMVVLNINHPDILIQKNGKPGFITCKADAEQMAHDLYSTGKYSAEFNDPNSVYARVPFQNANNSVRVTDEFMLAVENDSDWSTVGIKNKKIINTYKARHLWNEIAKAAWACGDPGLQFDTVTNLWHTCKASGRINASNPCSEYLYLDDTACNLSSLNLRKFTKNKAFDIGAFIHATQLAIIAKEIIVDASSYPSPLIKERSNKYRTLGLGYTNLGSLLTYWGLPYDSNQGRAVAAAITAIMGGVAYSMSAHLAKVQGPFPGYTESDENISNKDSMYEVMLQHLEAAKRIPVSYSRLWASLYDSAIDVWKDAVDLGRQYGYRNAQVTVMAPTGTISFLMDADTTGAEPNLGIVTFKKLVGGGYMKMPNRVVEPALHNLGYDREVIPIILEHIKEKGEIWSAPGFDSAKHGSIFAEALGDHALSPEAHIDMMAAIQPFLSGGISKTVNMPSNATVEDVTKLYMRAWKSGIKCVAIYRDGCKLSQPIATSLTETGKKEKALAWGERKRLPATRDSKTHRFTVGGQEGYITISFYADTGTLAEMFIRLAKTGSTMHGILDAWAIAVSMALQAGTPFDILKERYIDMRFDPSGITDDPAIRIAKSIPDYIFRWLDLHYGDKAETLEKITIEKIPDTKTNYDGPPCSKCGNITQRSGSCWLCKTCGNTTGCS